MKIAFVFHDGEIYGAPRSLLDLIDGLRQRKITCYAIVPYQGPLLEEINKRKIEYKIISYDRWVHKIYNNPWFKLRGIIRRFPDNRFLRAYKTLYTSFKIKQQLEKWKVDIVYTNTSVIAVGAIAAFLAGKKHVWHIREFQEIDQKLQLDWGKRLFSFMLKKSGAVIFISHALSDYYKNYIHEANDMVIYNGVIGKDEFIKIKQLKNKYSNEQNFRPFTFSMVGRISYEKGQHEAIKALALLVQEKMGIKLLIAGKGDTRNLIKLIQSLHLEEYVILLNHVDDPFDAVYFQSDAYLMCSAHEAFGRVTIEAMAASLPVIGKKNKFSATIELIQDNISGLLYEGDEVVLAEKMRQLVKNPEWGKQLGENAWTFARDNFNKELYVENIYTLLKNL